MPDEPDPPRKYYGFKEREFQRDNAPASQSPPQPTAEDLAKLAGNPVPKAQTPGPAKSADPNDVFNVLQQNRTVEQRRGADNLEIKKARSRRTKEFWLILVGGNAVIIGFVILGGFNVVSVIYGLAAVIVFSLSLSWVMWQVMNKY